MTLQNGLIAGGKAYLWSDTLLLNAETGEPVGLGGKCFYSLIQPWALSMTMIGSGDLSVIPSTMEKANPQSEDELRVAAEQALLAYCADGSLGRMLLACCWDEPRLFAIASDEFLGEPFGHYLVSHYIAPARHQNTKPPSLSRMPGVIAKQVTDKFTWGGGSSIGGAAHKIGGHVLQFEVSRDGVKETELSLPGKAGKVVRRTRAAGEAALKAA